MIDQLTHSVIFHADVLISCTFKKLHLSLMFQPACMGERGAPAPAQLLMDLTWINLPQICNH